MDTIAIIINTLADFNIFYFLTIFTTILLAFIYNHQANKYELESKRKKTVGIFFRLKKVEVLRLSLSYITLLYIISICLMFKTMETHHIYMYVFLSMVHIILTYNEKIVVYLILNRLLQGVALLLSNFLLEYVHYIRYDQQFVIVQRAATIIILMYSVYTFIGEVIQISEGRKIS